MKSFFLIFLLPCLSYAGPYYEQVISTTAGTSTMTISGYIGVAASSTTPTTYKFRIDGPNGYIQFPDGTHQTTANMAAISGSTIAVNAAQFTGDGAPLTPLNLVTSSVTLQGNSFNTAYELLLLDAGGHVSLPNLTGVIFSTAVGTYPLSITGNADTATTATNNVLKAGDTMTGNLTNTSSVTVKGALGLGVTYGVVAGTVTTSDILISSAGVGATSAKIEFESTSDNDWQVGKNPDGTKSGYFGILDNNGWKLAIAQVSGNVGIGNTTPAHKLSITGGINATSSITASGYYGDGSTLTGIIPSSATGNYPLTSAKVSTGGVNFSTITIALNNKLTSPATFYIVKNTDYLQAPATFYIVQVADYLTAPATFTIFANADIIRSSATGVYPLTSAKVSSGGVDFSTLTAAIAIASDNLGNHIATTTLNMKSFDIVAAHEISGVEASTQVTGGTISDDGDFRVHVFNADDDLIVAGADVTVEIMAVAGGGGGEWNYGGGGGAGGYISVLSTTIAAGTYSIDIGAGGTGGSSGVAPTNGQDTTGLGYTALGGARGDGYPTPNGPWDGGSGGGGGGRGGVTGGSGYAGPPRQGYDGGDGTNADSYDPAGGGGGSCGEGESTNSTSAGGDGGVGCYNDITGTNLQYGCGGGGSAHSSNPGGSGAAGCAGAGAGSSNSGADATANTGGGGGGGYGNGADPHGGAGGSGKFVVRYLYAAQSAALTINATYFTTIGMEGSGAALTGVIQSTATGTYPLSVSGNAATVTTNANLTGPVTSVGNATTIVGPVPVSTINLSTVTANHVLKAGDTMTGPLTLSGSTLTVTGNAFSVGGSTLVVDGGGLAVYQTTFTVKATGQVGINVAPVANVELHVGARGGVDTTPIILVGATTATGILISDSYIRRDGGIIYIDNMNETSSIQFRTSNASDIDTSNLTLKANGNVGIGTTVPDSKLHISSGTLKIDGNNATPLAILTNVANSAYIQSSLATGNAEFAVKNNQGDNSFIALDSYGSSASGSILGKNKANQVSLMASGSNLASMVIGTYTDDPLVFAQNNVTVATFTSTAFTTELNVGIGTASPGAKLEVNGTSHFVGTATFAGATGEFGVKVSSNLYVVGYSSANKYFGDGSSLTGITGGTPFVSSASANLANYDTTQTVYSPCVTGSTLTVTTQGSTRLLIGYTGSGSIATTAVWLAMSYTLDGVVPSPSPIALYSVATSGYGLNLSWSALSPYLSAGSHSVCLVFRGSTGAATSHLAGTADGQFNQFYVVETK